jgi:hypothetical protein
MSYREQGVSNIKTEGFYIKRLPDEKPSRFYIVNKATQETAPKKSGFYIKQVPNEEPTRIYIEKDITQEDIAKKPSGFYIKRLPDEKPSRFYVKNFPERVIFTPPAKKEEDEETE